MNKNEIKNLYEKFHVPKHVIAHMKKVHHVCEVLIAALKEKKVEVNDEAVLKAALVHDVLRICDFRIFEPDKFKQEITDEDLSIWRDLRDKYGKVGHIKGMSDLLIEMGEKEIAHVVSMHDFFKIDELSTWEDKIIFYADKRVDRDNIVSLEKRFEEGRKRNAGNSDEAKNLAMHEEKVIHLEKEFLEVLGKLPI